jgi:hypothetical protein
MTGVIRKVKEFHLNGWTIKPCDTFGFDLVCEGERYHYDQLEAAVAAAQSNSRPLEGETK